MLHRTIRIFRVDDECGITSLGCQWISLHLWSDSGDLFRVYMCVSLLQRYAFGTHPYRVKFERISTAQPLDGSFCVRRKAWGSLVHIRFELKWYKQTPSALSLVCYLVREKGKIVFAVDGKKRKIVYEKMRTFFFSVFPFFLDIWASRLFIIRNKNSVQWRSFVVRLKNIQ